MEIEGKYKINDSAVFGTGTWAIVKECVPINNYIPRPYHPRSNNNNTCNSSSSFIPKLVAKVIDKQKLKEIVKDEQNGQAIVQRELNILETLPAHPGVVRFVECIETDANYFLIFEAAIHGDLCELLLKSPTQRVEESTAQKYVVELIHGLLHCHRHNVVHRDIKPENILVSEGNVLKIADFGLAKTSNGGPAMNVMTGVIGTPALPSSSSPPSSPLPAAATSTSTNEPFEQQPPQQHQQPTEEQLQQQRQKNQQQNQLPPFNFNPSTANDSSAAAANNNNNNCYSSCNSNNMLHFLFPHRVFPKGTSLQTVMIEHRLRRASGKGPGALPSAVSLASSHDVPIVPSMLPPSPSCQGHEIMGTFRYGAPEMFEAKFANTSFDAFQADSWSLGVVTFIMLTGTFPFSAGSNADERQTWKVLRESTLALPSSREQGGETSPEACDFLARLLDKDPQRRMRLWDALDHPWLSAELRRQLNLARDSFLLPPKVQSSSSINPCSSSPSSSSANRNAHVVTIFADTSSPHFVTACQQLYPLSPSLDYMRKMVMMTMTTTNGDASQSDSNNNNNNNNNNNLKNLFNQLVLDHYQKFDALSRLRQSVLFGAASVSALSSSSISSSSPETATSNRQQRSSNNNIINGLPKDESDQFTIRQQHQQQLVSGTPAASNRAHTPSSRSGGGVMVASNRNAIRGVSPLRPGLPATTPSAAGLRDLSPSAAAGLAGGRLPLQPSSAGRVTPGGATTTTASNRRQSPSAGSLRGASQQGLAGAGAVGSGGGITTTNARATHASPISRFGAGATRRATPTPGARSTTPGATTTTTANSNTNNSTNSNSINIVRNAAVTPVSNRTATPKSTTTTGTAAARRASPLPSARAGAGGLTSRSATGASSAGNNNNNINNNASTSGTATSSSSSAAIGDVVTYKNAKAVVRFVGATKFAPGLWLGLELVGDGEGLHDGTSSIDKKRYFQCAPGKGVFVRPSQIGKADE